MKKTMWIIIILSTLLTGNCKKSTVVEPVEPVLPAADTMLVWKVPIYPDTALAYSSHFFKLIGGDKLLGGVVKLASADTGIIRMFDVSVGLKKDWEWQDYYPDVKQVMNGWVSNDNYAYVNGYNSQYGLNLKTGNTIWKNRIEKNFYPISLLEDRVFRIKNHGSKSTLYIADIAIGDWKSIFTVEGKDGFESDLNRVVGALNADGDMILYFQDRQYRYYPSTNRTNFYAYNLTKKEVLWELKDISPQTSNTSPAVLDETNRRMYFLTWHTIFCWDMDTGEEIWKLPLSAGVLASNPILYDGKLIMKTDQGYLTAFDADTGEELYYVKQGACCISSMIVYDGRLYYTDGRVRIVDPNTGEVIDKIRGDFQTRPPVIDSVRNVLYVMDSRYMYCYKIPE